MDELLLSPRKGLHDENLTARRDGVSEPNAIGDQFTVDEDRDMLADFSLIVEDVAAKPWIAAKHQLERFRHGSRLDFGGRALDMSLQVGCERNADQGGFPVNQPSGET